MSEEAKGDFGAYSHGQLIDATLYNIRRERRNELCAEALRWEDLKRWRACDQLISKPYRVEGMLYWGSDYEEQLQDLCKVDPAEGNMSSSDLSKYILPYEKITKNNLIAGLSYSANGSEVDTVIINGQITMENRKLLTIDEKLVYRKINDIIVRMGLDKKTY